MVQWLKQLFCKHQWKHRFLIDRITGTDIYCYCTKCGKKRRPDRYWPEPGDEIEEHLPARFTHT